MLLGSLPLQTLPGTLFLRLHLRLRLPVPSRRRHRQLLKRRLQRLNRYCRGCSQVYSARFH